MRKQWILVANGCIARLFSRTAEDDPLVAVETIEFPDSGFRGHRFARDRLVLERSHNHLSLHPEAHAGAHSQRMHPFAHQLAQRLEEGVVDGEYETFWLIASSPLLGDIKACLNRGVAYRLKWAQEADLTGLDTEALETCLRELREPCELGMPVH